MLSNHKGLNSKIILYLIFIVTISIAFSISCSKKNTSNMGILIETSEQSAPIPLVAWATFNYSGTDICQVSSAEGIPTKKGTRVEILEEATCLQTMINKATGESSTFSTGLSKILFPSPTNAGNARSGTFHEVWALSSTIKITDERFSSIGRREQSSSDRNRERKLRKQEIEERNAQRQKR